jgi:hypothetical protein
LFPGPGDYEAFMDLILDAKERVAVELFGFCLMTNRWHLVVRPKGMGDLAG